MFSLIIPPDSNPTVRRSHKKSKRGCLTCKERKLKCDEVHPICGNCSRRFIDAQPCGYGQKIATLAPKSNVPLDTRVNGRGIAQSTISRAMNFNSGNALPKRLSAELLDPFGAYPSTNIADVDVLMKHYLQKTVYKCFPWQPAANTNPTTTYYVPLVWNDEVLFHAMLLLSATGLDSRRKQAREDHIVAISAECIRLLRNRVESESLEKSVSDQTISAVATLAAIEHGKGNMRMLKMHMDGLKRMIGIRGGLNTLRESNPMVANSVFWMFVVAIYEIQFPDFDPVLPPFFPAEHDLSLAPVSHFEDFAPKYDHPIPLDLLALGLLEPITTIMNSVQHVSQLIPKFSSYPTAATSQIILTRMCTLLSHLLSLPTIVADANFGPESEYSAALSESTKFAILLHVFTPWRGLQPDGTLTINHFLHRLILSLRIMLSLNTRRNNELTLWIFATGGVAALNMPERTWFVGHLADMTEEMGIGSWEEMKENVSRGIWHERLSAKGHEILWGEVARIKDTREGRVI